jgi:hypothetical protein
MISFVKGLFHDQASKILKMLAELESITATTQIDPIFLRKTVEMLAELHKEVLHVIGSGDLDVDSLTPNNVIRYNTIHEKILNIELFRFLVIVNYGGPEIYFKKKITRIYKEINCFFQNPPTITTISNSDDYFWAFPVFHIIAVPNGEEKNLLNLPDLFHEMGHLFYSQYEQFLTGRIDRSLEKYYNNQILRVDSEQRDIKLKKLYRETLFHWIEGWVMEFSCDLIATYLVGPAYAWTNLKISTVNSGQTSIFHISSKHPSDEARMKAICCMLDVMGHDDDVKQIRKSWGNFLDVTTNQQPSNYNDIFPDDIIFELVENVYRGCISIDLREYKNQVSDTGETISKILNLAWGEALSRAETFAEWEKEKIAEINTTLIDNSYF